MEEDFEKRLQQLRELYLEGHAKSILPVSNAVKESFTERLSHISTIKDKEEKIKATLELLQDKKAFFEDLKTKTTDIAQLAEIGDHLAVIEKKRMLATQKLAMIQSGDYDPAKKEKMKRQLAALEVKLCKARLDNGDSHDKINKKIAHKKALFRKIFSQ